MYPIFQVPHGASDLPEALGTKFKFWYRHADVKTLYKEGRPGSGENWAEKVAAELADSLAIPHARYDLAHWQGRRGVVSPTFVPANGRLILGNEIITRLDSDYAEHAKRHKARQHTIGVVMALLGRSRRVIRPPIGYVMPAELDKAAEIFCGYHLETQQKLASLRSTTIQVTRVLFLQLPVWTTFYWNRSMLLYGNWALYIIQAAITLSFIFAAIWLFRNIKYENKDKKWFRLIFSGNEWDPVIRSIELLNEVKEFRVDNK